MTGHIKVLLVDDHLLFRKGVKALLAEQADLQLAAEASNYSEAIEFLRTYPCDLAVVDLSMPGRDGLDLIGVLSATYPRLPILVLTAHTEQQLATRAIRSGADGFITKDATEEELLNAMRRVAKGQTAISHRVAEGIAMQLSRKQESQPSLAELSGREFKIYQMLANGMRISSIAKELHLSDKTVSTYKSRILRKLGLENQLDFFRYSISHSTDHNGTNRTGAMEIGA